MTLHPQKFRTPPPFPAFASRLLVQACSLLLLLSLGCASSNPQNQFVEVVASGYRDFHLTCPHPGAPIRIESNYTGATGANVDVITNGTVIFYATGDIFDGLGWDSEDLKMGGHVLDSNLPATGASVVGAKWWDKIVEKDSRFIVHDALDFQNSEETPESETENPD